MVNKNELLTIGEMAKLTGVGIRALHYYERKNILRPAYIDPDTGYRYYSFNQSTLVVLIKNCVELDIPLKEFAVVAETDDITAFESFVEQSMETMERKSELLLTAVKAFEKILQKMELRGQYDVGQIYSRKIEDKSYYTKLYGQTITERHESVILEMSHELFGKYIKNVADIDKFDDLIPLPDVGYMCQHSHGEVNYYGFCEIAKHFTHRNAITIPAGTYFFRQDECSQIENANEIFKKQVDGRDSFIIVETEELFLGKTKVSQLMYELRLII
ncbi:MAG: MerR family DNA-binding transcriptional regulator [Firmicutes bacterium]|nr:MerR family DNA-binding transcriptional regulator [Bacillota bacterium]